MMTQELPKSLTDLLTGINSQDDENKLYVLTGTINLYVEAIRRCQGRVFLHTGDIRAILDMAYTMCVNQPTPIKLAPVTKEDREPTTAEIEALEKAVVTHRRA